MSPVAQFQTQDLARNKDSDITVHTANTNQSHKVQEAKQTVRCTAWPFSINSPVERVAITETQEQISN